jgi:hypothetical protein
LPPWNVAEPHKDNWQTVAKLRAETEAASAPEQASTPMADLTAQTTFIDHHHHDF